MAVYTELGAETLAQIIDQFDVGSLVSAKGIAEGVSNSNWLIETTGDGPSGTRFILTMYEARTKTGDLPFFLGLLDHLALRGCPVPRTIHDKRGDSFVFHEGKALALIEFLPGVSVTRPTTAQIDAVGSVLAQIHLAAQDFTPQRPNDMGLARWHNLAKECGTSGLNAIHAGLAPLVETELARLNSLWPKDLPISVIHADLFPDNVLMVDNTVTGVIDFYFACTDITAYDLAVTHAAWCFSDDGHSFDKALSAALLDGYQRIRPLLPAERAALPILASGAAMRFLLTRAYDWMHTPTGALVTRKDPMAFARRLQFYGDPANHAFFA